MTANQITRICYAGSIGFLSWEVFGAWGLLISPCIIVASNTLGELLGEEDS